MGSINYIPLRTTSQYSLLEGAMQIESIVNKAINHKIPAIGLTDRNNLFGALEFSEKLKSTGNSDDWKLSKKLEPKMRVYVPVIVRVEEVEGVKFLGLGKLVYAELLGVECGLLVVVFYDAPIPGGHIGYAQNLRDERICLVLLIGECNNALKKMLNLILM